MLDFGPNFESRVIRNPGLTMIFRVHPQPNKKQP